MSLDQLFQKVREECSKSTWSKGILLVRDDGVTGDEATLEEVFLRVLDKSTGIGPKVTLWLEDEDWHCDCGSHEDPCEHVAASVIALKRSREQGVELPKSSLSSAHLVYDFYEEDNFLCLERVLVQGDLRQILAVPLSRIQSGEHQALMKRLTPTKEDWAIEVALHPKRHGALDRATYKRMMPHLALIDRDQTPSAPRILFQGSLLNIDKSIIQPVALLRNASDDAKGGWFLKEIIDTNLKRVFRQGVCLTHAGLAIIEQPELLDADRDMLRKGKHFYKSELSQLLNEILPRLRGQIRIEGLEQLPTLITTSLHVDLRAQILEDGLWLNPRIVYGNPAIAHIEGAPRPGSYSTNPQGELVVYGNQIPKRDLAGEQRLGQTLHANLGLQIGYPQKLTTNQAISWIKQAQAFDAWLMLSKEIRDFYKIRGQLQGQLQFSQTAMKVSFQLASEHDQPAIEVPFEAVWEAYARGESLIALPTNGYGTLPEDFLRQHGQSILDLLASLGNDGQLPQSTWLEARTLAKELGSTYPKEFDRLQEDLTNYNDEPWVPPRGFRAALRHYQWEGVTWLDRLRRSKLGALVADDMGLGKTLQSIGVLRGLSLIVAPKSVLFNWQQEIQKFSPETEVHFHHGSQRQTASTLSRLAGRSQTVVITSYALMRRDIHLLQSIYFDEIILDEAQMIKNPQSQTSLAALRLKGHFRIALTGTPIENSLMDLYAQFRFLNPGLLGNPRYFGERYLNPISQGDTARASLLLKRTSPFILRRLKSQVLDDLPPKTESLILCELSHEERKLYQTIWAASLPEIVQSLKSGGKSLDVLTALLRLRQACCHPRLLPDGPSLKSSKTTVLLTKLASLVSEGHKALVFSQWTSYLDLIGEGLEQRGLNFLRLDGATKNREDIVSRFNCNEGHPILLMSLKAGGVGLNLTAADHVFITDPWWNPASENQAADRIYRIGQDKPVMIYRLVAKDTIEEQIMALKAKKDSLADSILTHQSQSQISSQDILELFGHESTKL